MKHITPLPPPNELKPVTDANLVMVEKFKQEIKHLLKEHHDDYFCRRWLVATNWNMRESIKMLQKHMQWREEYNVDTIMEDFPKSPYSSYLLQHYPINFNHSVTEDGSLVNYEASGRANIGNLLKVPTEYLIQFHIWIMETRELKLRELKEEYGYYPGIVAIVDLLGLSMGNLGGNKGIQLLRQFTQIDAANYPETLRKIYLVNVPGFFKMIWRVVKPLLEQRTLDKFSIGSEFNEELRIIIGPETLPSLYGGECECEGGCMPEKGTFELFEWDG
eukprot:TRINITY_DN1215_c0_g1_i1.p1 TRINITY_DN1215_c0_g1~~TRINITY_DN1215_c0_g1_i1.p1  ORF type:complete len:275 (-),score=65.24 TRINITY_DN1215_c0_g1_i1:399-1223(-)